MLQFDKARNGMINDQLAARKITDTRVLAAFRRVPRERFVPEALQNQAYEDTPLLIGEAQTISQPYVVALMTEALMPETGMSKAPGVTSGSTDLRRVLEIGTGSGYQTAILCELFESVYSIERHPVLLNAADSVLQTLGYENYELKLGDGTLGWQEHAPFDAIIATAGSPEIPSPLFAQLSPDGGRLVIPTGPPDNQVLRVLVRRGGTYEETNLGAVRFVPMIGAHAWSGDTTGQRS